MLKYKEEIVNEINNNKIFIIKCFFFCIDIRNECKNGKILLVNEVIYIFFVYICEC